MITLQNVARALTAVMLCCGVVGCGGPKTHPLSGRVVYAPDQTPAGDLAGYGVTAVCADPPITAVGVIEDDGSFVLSTFGEKDGAVAGHYRVALTPPLPYGDEPPSPVLIDAKYLDLDTSGLEIEIPGDEVVLTVERPADPK
jgi:hypothetical protein